MSAPPRLILASASPRRQELLAAAGLDVNVIPSDLDESSEEVSKDPARAAEQLALSKARSVAAPNPHDIVIGADTMVVDSGTVLGKPAAADEATHVLASLRDREHQVITGVAVVFNGRSEVAHALTQVRMRDYSDQEIAAYIARGEPFDKAGAYAIQDPQFKPVERWDGCYCNVVGLPVALTLELIASVAPELHFSTQRLPAQCDGCLQRQRPSTFDS